MKIELVTVIHKAFEDKARTVALVEIPNDPLDKVFDKLNFAYRWTQNINGSWALKMGGDGNSRVTVIGDTKGDTLGIRSTSIGDQMIVGTERFVVAEDGFESLGEYIPFIDDDFLDACTYE